MTVAEKILSTQERIEYSAQIYDILYFPLNLWNGVCDVNWDGYFNYGLIFSWSMPSDNYKVY